MQRCKKWLAVLFSTMLVIAGAVPLAASEETNYEMDSNVNIDHYYQLFVEDEPVEEGGFLRALWRGLNLQDWQDFMDSDRTIRDFRNFLRSNLGQTLIFIIAGVLFFTIAGFYLKRAKFSMVVLTYAGAAMALAFMLSFITLFRMPQGGSITPMSMFVVSLIGFWFGPTIGLTAGVTYGLLQLIQGAHMIHPVQLLLDYPLAFGMLGLSGFFRKVKWGMYVGFIAGALGRFIMSTLAGWLYWLGPITPASLWASIVYNSSYIFPEIGLTLVMLAIPALRKAVEHVTKRARAEMVRINND